jgi:hypothetical protein
MAESRLVLELDLKPRLNQDVAERAECGEDGVLPECFAVTSSSSRALGAFSRFRRIFRPTVRSRTPQISTVRTYAPTTPQICAGKSDLSGEWSWGAAAMRVTWRSRAKVVASPPSMFEGVPGWGGAVIAPQRLATLVGAG